MKREPGYYWVKTNPVNLSIAEFNGLYWLFCGNLCAYEDKEFLEIDERRIEHEN